MSLLLARLTVGQDVQALLALHEVLSRLFDSREIREVNVQELKAAIRARVGFLDLLNGGVGLALRAPGYVDGAVVLV